MSLELSIEEVERIEGHAGVRVVIEGNNVITEFRVFEGARLFEDFLMGKRVDDIPRLTSRICGICGITHSVAASKALDKALGIELSDNIKLVRKLLLNLNVIESHLLHVIFLSLPDIYSVKSFIELPRDVFKESLKVINLRECIGKLIKTLIGDRVHGKSFTIGGFTYLPPKNVINDFKDELIKGYELLRELTNEIMDKYREWIEEILISKYKHYIALKNNNEYSLYEGNLVIDNDKVVNEDKFSNEVYEISVSYSTAKRVYLNNGEPFMVGALARLLVNEAQIPKELIKIANEILHLSNYVEPGIIPLAQLIESAYLLLKSSEMLDDYENRPYVNNDRVRMSGIGIAIIEAPRGILLHEYVVSNGIIRYSNIITPTAFFAADIEDSIKYYTLSRLSSAIPLGDLESKISEIVRCYDPCISCSVHIVKL